MKLSPIILAISLTAFMAPSCSIFKPASQQDGDKKIVSSQAVKPDKKDKKNKDQGKNKPADSKLAVKPTQEQLSGGEWRVTGVGKINITAEEDVPYVHFGPDGRFYASDGCNIINGNYVLRSDGSMGFSGVLSTMKYCPDVEYSALIASMFNDEARPTVDCRRIGQDTYLYFKDKSGNTMMTLRRHNREFLNGNWRVTAIDGRAIDDEEANIFIDIAELKVHGNTGCNYFNGDLYIDPQRSNAIDFSDMGVTRMACPKGDQERQMLVALEETKTAIAGDREDTVLLLDKAGKAVLTLKRIPMPEND